MQQDASTITGLGLVVFSCMACLTWVLPRRWAVVPLLITTCYMPLGQMFVVGGLHFPVFRLLLLMGLVRVWSRDERAGLQFTRLDRLFFWWALACLVVGTLTKFSFARFVNRSGEVYNAAGTYFLVRCWVRNQEDLVRLVRCMAIMIVPLAVSMIVEKLTARNIFYVLGGVADITQVREGRLRCQGAFRNPILAGTYSATLFPLFVGLWYVSGGKKKLALLGAVSATVVTVASASSGPLLATIVAGGGLALWRFRHQMHWLRRGLVVITLGLALVMNAPVWYIIARVSDLTGGTGWHRSFLIDQAVRHLGEWWLVGSTYTAHWAPAGQVLGVDPDNMDITNHYVAEGLGGGVLRLGLFVAMIVSSYKILGRLAGWSESLPVSSRRFIWCIGVCLTAHCASFISISYFDQIVVMWYWLLACVSTLAAQYLEQPVSRCDGVPSATPATGSALESV